MAGFSRAQSVDEGLARSPVQRENSFLTRKGMLALAREITKPRWYTSLVARVLPSIVPKGNNATVQATLLLLSPSSLGDLKDFPVMLHSF